jgi:hypothetical protein
MLAVGLLFTPEAFAQTSAEKAAAAQVLFDEGMKLMASVPREVILRALG